MFPLDLRTRKICVSPIVTVFALKVYFDCKFVLNQIHSPSHNETGIQVSSLNIKAPLELLAHCLTHYSPPPSVPLKIPLKHQGQWCIPLIPAGERQRQEDRNELETSLRCIMTTRPACTTRETPSQKQNQKNIPLNPWMAAYIVQAIQEAKAGEFLEPTSSRPAWAAEQIPASRLIN